MIDYKKNITQYFDKLQETISLLNIEEINSAMNAIKDAYDREANIYIFGNGGSAATASHYVCDFNKGVSGERKKKFRLRCLNDNIATLMAIANDISYDDVFFYQLQGLLTKNDLIIAISGSGNSRNVIKAVEYAKELGTQVVGITGYKGGKLKKLSDFSLHVDIDDMQITEDIHMVFDHMMMRVFCDTF